MKYTLNKNVLFYLLLTFPCIIRRIVSVTDGSSFNAGLLSIPSIIVGVVCLAILRVLAPRERGTEEDKDRGDVRRVILAGGVSGDVLLKRSQVGSVFALQKQQKKNPIR